MLIDSRRFDCRATGQCVRQNSGVPRAFSRAGSRSDHVGHVFIRLEEVWAFEAAERLAYVHTSRGRFDVDLSLSAVEASFGRTLLRVHRKWLVNTEYVYELEGAGSETELRLGVPAGPAAGLRVPVARERAQRVRAALLGNTLGIRAR
ncbi:MAG: LytTR family transcriptional regulator [Deltaproteobacteria bacterium]|nr:MAG: LytTR family transcriptional regulator [Deltaproteobacteria bacterium]